MSVLSKILKLIHRNSVKDLCCNICCSILQVPKLKSAMNEVYVSSFSNLGSVLFKLKSILSTLFNSLITDGCKFCLTEMIVFRSNTGTVALPQYTI